MITSCTTCRTARPSNLCRDAASQTLTYSLPGGSNRKVRVAEVAWHHPDVPITWGKQKPDGRIHVLDPAYCPACP
jgi:hypothetical protein